jgi:hypothetical protein
MSDLLDINSVFQLLFKQTTLPVHYQPYVDNPSVKIGDWLREQNALPDMLKQANTLSTHYSFTCIVLASMNLKVFYPFLP